MESLNEILKWCKREQKEFWEYMLYDDMNERNVSKEDSVSRMEHVFDTMCEAVDSYGEGLKSASGLVGASGVSLEIYRMKKDWSDSKKKKALCGDFMGQAMVVALKMAEANACMRRIVAAPTAGSCGVLPAVLIPYYRMHLGSKEDVIRALYVAGAIGEVIASRASVSGAQGGCQAEIGAASAMAAGALVYLQGGENEDICHGAALALKGLLGLVCDPVAGLVEVPCVKRNVLGTVNAISCTDMVCAGIRSQIPPDEVIDAMAEVGEKMDVSLRETARGGLAMTGTGQKIAEKLSLS